MGGGKVGLTSDTEVNLQFKKKKKEKKQQYNGKKDSVPCMKEAKICLSIA